LGFIQNYPLLIRLDDIGLIARIPGKSDFILHKPAVGDILEFYSASLTSIFGLGIWIIRISPARHPESGVAA
jgi:hypothetical protein